MQITTQKILDKGAVKGKLLEHKFCFFKTSVRLKNGFYASVANHLYDFFPPMTLIEENQVSFQYLQRPINTKFRSGEWYYCFPLSIFQGIFI